jgi:hypothetical protein
MLRDPIKSNLARAPVPDDYLHVMITYVVMMILFTVFFVIEMIDEVVSLHLFDRR